MLAISRLPSNRSGFAEYLVKAASTKPLDCSTLIHIHSLAQLTPTQAV